MSLAQRRLHVAQLAPDGDHLAAELLDRLLVLLGQDGDRAAALAALGLDLGELVLQVLQLGGERLLLLAEALLGVAADARSTRSNGPLARCRGRAGRSAPRRPTGCSSALTTKAALCACGIATCWPRKSRTSTQNWSASMSAVGDDDDVDAARRECGLASALAPCVGVGLGLRLGHLGRRSLARCSDFSAAAASWPRRPWLRPRASAAVGEGGLWPRRRCGPPASAACRRA